MSLITVKNASRGPLSLDPAGVIPPGGRGMADPESPHTRALLADRQLIEITEKPARASRPRKPQSETEE